MQEEVDFQMIFKNLALLEAKIVSKPQSLPAHHAMATAAAAIQVLCRRHSPTLPCRRHSPVPAPLSGAGASLPCRRLSPVRVLPCLRRSPVPAGAKLPCRRHSPVQWPAPLSRVGATQMALSRVLRLVRCDVYIYECAIVIEVVDIDYFKSGSF